MESLSGLKNASCEKILGVKFDQRLILFDHISDLRKKASCRIHALARMTPHMKLPKKCFLLNAFFTSQFNYCPFIWKSGVQPDIFHGMGDFIELGHFVNILSKHRKKKVLLGKILDVFLLDTLKTTF